MKLNVQAHQKAITEDDTSHLIQFAVHEEDLDIIEDVYTIGMLVVVEYSTPTRDVVIEGTVTGFEYSLTCEDPYASCSVGLTEEEEDYNV
jgi:hypothetical protein